MHFFQSLGAVFILGLLCTTFAAASEQTQELHEYSYYLVSYPSSDIATIAQSQEQLQQHFGDRLEGYVDAHQYIVYAAADELQSLQDNAVILSSVPYVPTTSETLFTEGTTQREVIISLFAHADAQEIAEQLQTFGMQIQHVYPPPYYRGT